MLDDLPPELRSNILLRLPVDCLLRFRCVSKFYCAEIDSPKFIKAHLKRSLDTRSNQAAIFGDRIPDSLYSVSFDSPSKVAEIDYPLKNDEYHSIINIMIIGSCNGLFCFSNAIGRVALVNPATRKSKTLPLLPLEHKTKGKSDWNIWSFGFGYDPVSDDYKVVRLGQFMGVSSRYFSNETVIYSLKSNSWRTISGMPYILGTDHKMGLLVNDTLHWLVDRNRVLTNPRVIVGFNLKSEEFKVVPEPELPGCNGGEYPDLLVASVGEWLSICANYVGTFDIWVMKEYGVKESWTKLVSITQELVAHLKYMGRSPFSKSGDEILFGMQGKNLAWYNLKGRNVKIMEMPDVGTPFGADVFHESLVSLDVCQHTKAKESSSNESAQKGRKGKANRDDFLSKGFKLKL